MQIKENGVRVIAEHLLAICEGSNPDNDPETHGFVNRQHIKRIDDEQQRAMYIATVVLNAIENAQFRNIFSRTTPKLESIVRNAIYTALHAEATYKESPASRIFTDLKKAQIPKWYEPAKLLRNLTPHRR